MEENVPMTTKEIYEVESARIDTLLIEWNYNINELSNKEWKLIQIKEKYSKEEQDILTNFDFNEAYGANNDKIRKNHIKKALKPMVDEQNALGLSINYLKRRNTFLKTLVDVKKTSLYEELFQE